jgi:hypothetical protein
VLQNGGKLVPDARGDADCVRAQEGGGRSEARVLLSVPSSWDTRGRTARYGSLRRRNSFLAAAAPRVESKFHKMNRLDGHPELKKWAVVGAQIFSTFPNKRALRRQYGAKRPKCTEAGYY